MDMFRRGRENRRNQEDGKIKGEGTREYGARGKESQKRDKDQQEQEHEPVEVEDAEEDEEEYPDNVDLQEIPEGYEEEDVYVVIELPPGYDTETISTSAVTVKGIGTEDPQLKVGETTLKGKAEPIVGTSLVFQTPPASSSGREPLQLKCYSSVRMDFNQPDARGRKRAKR